MKELPKSARKELVQLQSRHGRKKSDYFVCEGLRVCEEAIRRRPDWIEFALYSEGHAPLDFEGEAYVLPEDEFNACALTENPQGVLLLLRRPAQNDKLPAEAMVLPVLDRVQDPGNAGTIMRACWAAGLSTLVYTRGTVDPFSPKAIRAGMGAQFSLDLIAVESLEDLVQAAPQRQIWLADMTGDCDLWDAAFQPDNSFLVFGNEAGGVSDLPSAKRVYIPMPGGSESLNVAMAASILCFEAVRRKQAGQGHE